jgi:hypothetical protein
MRVILSQWIGVISLIDSYILPYSSISRDDPAVIITFIAIPHPSSQWFTTHTKTAAKSTTTSTSSPSSSTSSLLPSKKLSKTPPIPTFYDDIDCDIKGSDNDQPHASPPVDRKDSTTVTTKDVVGGKSTVMIIPLPPLSTPSKAAGHDRHSTDDAKHDDNSIMTMKDKRQRYAGAAVGESLFQHFINATITHNNIADGDTTSSKHSHLATPAMSSSSAPEWQPLPEFDDVLDDCRIYYQLIDFQVTN